MSLWSYANPLRDDRKELCDVLVVCDPHVIIFSVKEVAAKDTGRPDVDWERWARQAVKKSADQVFGAERELRRQSHVIRRDGARGLAVPPAARRQVHRVVVALGSEGRVPIAIPRFSGGHVHVLEERSLNVVMNELDTITDFTGYLGAKAQFLERTSFVAGNEEDLLAFYLKNGRTFPGEHDVVMLDNGLWNAFSEHEAVRARNEANRASRAFDEIITRIMKDAESGTLEPGSDLTKTEELLRVMAGECRFNRRVLGSGFMDLMRRAAAREGGLSRMTLSPSGVVYVFLAMPRSVPRLARTEELALRTFVARGLNPESTTAVGIATEQVDGEAGLSIDACLVRIPTWTEEHRAKVEGIQRDLGIFVEPELTRWHDDEYPGKAGSGGRD